jgi:RNA polymerase sigma-70 factor (sigma-E family)
MTNRAGPERGFDAFVEQSLPSLGRYAYILTGDVHATEDLVQDTLVKLAGAWRRINQEGNPIGYARAVMFRTFVSRWRFLRRHPAQEIPADRPAGRDEFADVDVRDQLRRAMAGLPRLQRAVLVLGYLDDLADEEIARLLERRPATIRSLRHRGLQTLRQRMGAGELEEESRAAV